ncbi:putative cystoskeletal protein tektin [Paragonimus heterotremus]|uniref:Tektin n=1 Tax=Paragonimus heterotremus TaxID=100268 RepID=A0A8J4TDA8_9TREM|nr:putative cystoskeletal protein tektin [Paragonimus heterotremus]
MEFIGHSPTACYLSSTRRQEVVSKLPCATTLPKLAKAPSFTCPSPYPHKRTLTTVGFRPATYYSASKTNPRYPLSHSQVDSSAPESQLSELCGVRVPSVYSAARNALYTRYTPRDWFASYQRLLQSNDRGQKDSECLRYDSERLMDETNERTKNNQNESSRQLGDRLSDIAFWQNELTDELDKMVKEINDLVRGKRVAEKLLAEVENQLHIAQECLYQREKRQCVDLVHDNVEKALLAEVETVLRSQEMLRNLIDRANTQLEMNRAAQHEMEVDLKNKFTAQQIDETAVGMKNSSAGVHYYEGVENIEQCASVPETWNQHVHDIVSRSRAERAASRKLREDIGNGLAQIGQFLAESWADVNTALAQRIREVTDARNQLQSSLGHTLQEIFDTEREIEALKAAIRAKEAYLKTATSRLNIRLRRPGMEHVCDAAQMQLKCEVAQIKDSIRELKQQLCRAQDILQELLRLRSAKEAELAVKNNSIFIDREKCLALRSNWPGGPTAKASHGAPCPCINANTPAAASIKACAC